jgi:flagellar protein FliT
MERGSADKPQKTTRWRKHLVLELLNNIDRVNGCLITLLKNGTVDVEDDGFIEQLEQLLGLREQLFAAVKKAETAEEIQLGERIIQDNEQINQLLNEQTQQLKKEINQFNQKKKHNQQYDNPYQNTYVDGTFIDKKK